MSKFNCRLYIHEAKNDQNDACEKEYNVGLLRKWINKNEQFNRLITMIQTGT